MGIRGEFYCPTVVLMVELFSISGSLLLFYFFGCAGRGRFSVRYEPDLREGAGEAGGSKKYDQQGD